MADIPPDALKQFFEKHGPKITQDSERLFINDFLFPLLGNGLLHIVPQHPFLDSTGRSRRIDFAYVSDGIRIAMEVNGETYHAEGIIPNDMFDDNLFRQNEILSNGYKLIRFSYSQLQSPQWRPVVMNSLRSFLTLYAPKLLGENPVKPNSIQKKALEALGFYRDSRHWTKGIVVLPTGTGKTILSALDVRRIRGRALFLVHRLEILKQSVEAFQRVLPEMVPGILTGEVKENVHRCDVLFASKDTLRQPEVLSSFKRTAFAYVVVDEVHHGQSLSYKDIFTYFTPAFMLGMTATPDRLDRKDIFELFDYNKIYEVTLQQAIDDGYLVPYDYYGLVDDVDYSKIRYQGNRYRVDDLEKFLIVPERNAAILREYLDKGGANKAIGFCVSIKHAERMAEFFQKNGIPSAAVTSATPNRDATIRAFRQNQLNVVFTVDIFNEGVDFPNVRVLMFLRPTESKTVFLQQLGRGLRSLAGKDRVSILDFIGNFQRANQIRKWLAKSAALQISGEGANRKKKYVYTYSTGCEVHFDAKVEQLLDSQDEREIEVTKDDLKEAYFALAEELEHKPSRNELNEKGKYKIALYLQEFGSWVNFIREIGEYTEASYHYPQGVHLGHLLSILKVFGGRSRNGTHFDDEYIRLRGDLGHGRLSAYRRQVKYKLQAAMELGLLPDDRSFGPEQDVSLKLTPLGRELHDALSRLLESLDLKFQIEADHVPSSTMALEPWDYNERIREFLQSKPAARQLFLKVFLGMPAIQQMLQYLFQVARTPTVQRATVYKEFFAAPFVSQFCDQEGIEEATDEAAKHRCPFLLNVLDACGFISQTTQGITALKLVVAAPLVRAHVGEKPEESQGRAERLWKNLKDRTALSDEDVSLFREMFGKEFLTAAYHLKDVEYVDIR